MRRATVVAVLYVFVNSTISAQDVPELLPESIPGHVGFSQIAIADSSRSINNMPVRPITVSLWYPAVPASGQAMRLKTYVEQHRHVDSLGVLPFDGWVTRSKTDTSLVTKILESEAKAHLDATPAAGKFPLILYAASFRAPAYENFALFEFLAGYGFVVAAISSVGRDITGISMDSIGVQAQMRDFELVYQQTLALPNIDQTRVGTMGFSLGAVPAVRLALDDKTIQATVNIDGALNYTYALLGSQSVSASSLHAAYLQLTQRPVSSMPMDNTFFETNAKGVAYHLQWQGLDHYDLGSVTALLRAARPKDYQASEREVQLGLVNPTPTKERIRMYQELVRTIYLFFDTYLGNSPESRSALETVFDEPDSAAFYSVRVRK